MKQLIGLICLGGLTAAYAALYAAAHQQTRATDTPRGNGSKKFLRQVEPSRELVLLGLDGTIIAREVNLAAPSASDDNAFT